MRLIRSIKRERKLTRDEEIKFGAYLMGQFFLRGGRGALPKEADTFLDAMEEWLKATKDPRLTQHPDGEIEVVNLPQACIDFTHYKAMEEEAPADKAYRA